MHTELGLRNDPWPHALQSVLDRALVLLGDAAKSGGDAGRPACDAIEACRAALSSRGTTTFLALAGRGLDAFAAFQSTLGQEHADRRQEVASLVELVRDAISAMSGDADQFHADVDASAGRFDDIAHLNDLRQIKLRLIEEVDVLRAVSAARHTAWTSTVQRFSNTIATLEEQLAETKTALAIDTLTNVANRSLFDRTLKEWLQSARESFVLAMVDIDHFKAVNDTHGHAAGDQTLMGVASILAGTVRARDLVARYGGDEFVILLEDVTLSQALTRLQQSVVAVREAHTSDMTPVSVTISCGAAECSAGDTAAALLARADAALYDAKRAGRDRVAVKEAPFVRDLVSRPGPACDSALRYRC